MPKAKDIFASVRKIGLALPGVEASTAYGAPALKLRGKLMACIPTHRSAEPDSLVLLVGFEERDALIAEQPDIYYTKAHYLNFPSVLVRLPRVNEEILRDLLAMSHKYVAAKSKRGSSAKARRRAKPAR